MTENEIKILLRLNKSRSQNNVDDVLSEELEIPKYDVGQAMDSLLQKGYVYEDSNTNQKNLGLKAWKITEDGERKVNELKNNEIAKNPIASSINDENEKLQNDLLKIQIDNGRNERKERNRSLKWTLVFTIIGGLIGVLPKVIDSIQKNSQPTYIVIPSTDLKQNNKDSFPKIKDETKPK